MEPGRGIKRILPRTLFGRSLLILVTPLVLVQLIASWIFFDQHWDTVSRRLAHGVAGDVALAVRMAEVAPGEHTYSAIAAATDIRVRFREGAALGPPAAPDTILARRLAEVLAIRLDRPFRVAVAPDGRDLLVDVQLAEGVLEALAPRRRLFTATTYVVLVWMVGSSLILLLIAAIFMRNQVRPIRRLAAAADAFGKGRDVGDFRIAGAAEVRQAGLAFKLMRDRIQRQITQRTEMLAGVSHDLRTPLTRMKLALALPPDGEDMRELQQDVADMERMLEAYLAFARGEAGEAATATDLAVLLDEAAGAARRTGADVALQRPDRLMLPLRPNAIRRCLDNLIGNAARFGRHVRIAAEHCGDAVEIIIDDDGPGIAAVERENVFRPFYRLDPSRSPATGGIGLGLGIARDVAHGHGGDITLGDSPNGGLRVRLRLPV